MIVIVRGTEWVLKLKNDMKSFLCICTLSVPCVLYTRYFSYIWQINRSYISRDIRNESNKNETTGICTSSIAFLFVPLVFSSSFVLVFIFLAELLCVCCFGFHLFLSVCVSLRVRILNNFRIFKKFRHVKYKVRKNMSK